MRADRLLAEIDRLRGDLGSGSRPGAEYFGSRCACFTN